MLRYHMHADGFVLETEHRRTGEPASQSRSAARKCSLIMMLTAVTRVLGQPANMARVAPIDDFALYLHADMLHTLQVQPKRAVDTTSDVRCGHLRLALKYICGVALRWCVPVGNEVTLCGAGLPHHSFCNRAILHMNTHQYSSHQPSLAGPDTAGSHDHRVLSP